VTFRTRARDEWDEDEHGHYEDDETDDNDLRPKPHYTSYLVRDFLSSSIHLANHQEVVSSLEHADRSTRPQ